MLGMESNEIRFGWTPLGELTTLPRLLSRGGGTPPHSVRLRRLSVSDLDELGVSAWSPSGPQTLYHPNPSPSSAFWFHPWSQWEQRTEV